MKYSKNMYAYKAIDFGKEAYKHLCKIEITETEQYWQVSFTECKVDKDILKKEFSNFIIEVMNGADMFE